MRLCLIALGCAALVTSPLASGEEGPLTKGAQATENAIGTVAGGTKKAAVATADGTKKATTATVDGTKKAATTTAGGVQKGTKATLRTIGRGLSSTGNVFTKSGQALAKDAPPPSPRTPTAASSN